MNIQRTNFSLQNEFITMFKGDTLSFGVEVYDETGNPMEVSDMRFNCEENDTNSSFAFSKTTADGISAEETGKYVIRVAPDDTVNMEAGKYYYYLDIEMNGDRFTILSGTLEILPKKVS